MQHSHTRNFNTTLKKVAECFEKIGWDKKLNELTELQVLGIVATIKSIESLIGSKNIFGKIPITKIIIINSVDSLLSSPNSSFKFGGRN